MSNNIYLSSKALDPRGSVVISAANPTPARIKDLVLSDQRSTNLYVVDGNGGYDAISGDVTASVIASIGVPGLAPVWVNSSWVAITNGWTGEVAANTVALGDLFTSEGINPLELELSFKVTNSTSKPQVFANPLIKIWNRYPGSLVSTNPFANSGDGEYTIPNGSDVGSVTGLALTLIPRRVLVSVRKPAGGLNLYASVVAGTITKDGFDFTLNGQTDAATYKLDYVLLY